MFNAIVKTFMNQAPSSQERGVRNNIVAGPRSRASAGLRENSNNSSRNAFDTKAGNSNLVESLKKEGAKVGIHPEIFYTANNLTTCLLDGQTAIKIFGSSSASKSSNLPEAKNFLENLFQTFFTVFNLKSKDAVADSVSPLETLYQKSQNAANIDNLGEPWEHFKKALATGHYQLMPIYNENSKGLLEPAAFAVFEKLDMGETKTSLFKQLAHSSFSAADIKNTKVNFLDKVITNGFDPNLDMNALQRFSVEAFMNMQSRDSVLMVPWRADAVEKLSNTVVKGVNHIGFTRINGDIQITPRHEIEGREYPTLKATTIFTKYPKDFETRELKALTLLQVLSELSAGPVMRFSGAAAKQQIKALVDDTFRNIDAERASESRSSFNPFKILAGFFGR
ncbi:MAG: hypothetical protein ACKO3R_09025 [bacterium]